MNVTRGFLERTVGHLRFPWLFLLTVAVFVVDLLVPDAIPLVDEILLGLLSLLLGSLRKGRRPLEKGEGDRGGELPGGK